MKLIKLLIIPALLLAVFSSHPAKAEVAAPQVPLKDAGKVIMLVIDQVSWKELTNSELKNINRLTRLGACGLMTTNPSAGSTRNPANTYLTIGAGSKISGEGCGGFGFNVDEKYRNAKAVDSYKSRTGADTRSQVVHLGIGQIENVNESLKYEYSPGAIGTILHQHGIKTAVLGNADISSGVENEKFRRFAVGIAMDNQGQVDYGDVSMASTTADTSFPGGIRTNYPKLLSKSVDLLGKSNLLVIETGDTSRIEDQSRVVTPERLAELKHSALRNIDNFVGQLLRSVDLKKDLMMVVVPGPSSESMKNGEFLTPIIMTGKNVTKGAIWSGTTKRNGLISNIDIVPTILRYFNLPPVVNGPGGKKDILLNGQIIESKAVLNSINQVSEVGAKTLFMHNARYPFVKTYINTCLVVMLAAVGALKFGIIPSRIVKPFLLAMTFLPVVMMAANLVYTYSMGMAGGLMIVLVILMTLVALLCKKIWGFNPFLVSTGLTVFVLVGDLFAGAPLIKTSPLGYDAAAGARFYGIGNEYMGVLIGAAMVFTALLLDNVKKVPAVVLRIGVTLLLGLVVFTISAPSLGTNVGGAIAALAGIGTAVVIIFGRQPQLKTLISVGAASVALLTVVVLFDATRAVETQSHMGRTIGLIRENGFSEIADIIIRKSAVNLKLIRNTTWSWVFALGLAGILFRRELFPLEADGFKSRNPWLEKLIPGFAIGSIFALIFNDSGIVAAATVMNFAAPPVLWEMILIREGNG